MMSLFALSALVGGALLLAIAAPVTLLVLFILDSKAKEIW